MKKEELIKRSSVHEAFTLVNDNKKIKIVVGKYLVSEKVFKTYKEADEYIAQTPWELILNMIAAYVLQTEKNVSKITDIKETNENNETSK